MSSTATWPPGAIQSTETEPGNKSVIPAAATIIWQKNLRNDFLASPLISVFRARDVKGSHSSLQDIRNIPEGQRPSFKEGCRNPPLARLRRRRCAAFGQTDGLGQDHSCTDEYADFRVSPEWLRSSTDRKIGIYAHSYRRS